MDQHEVQSVVRTEVRRVLPAIEINWETLGHQMDSLDRLEFVENLSEELSVSLEILLMKPGVWSSLESLSEFIYEVISRKIHE